MKIYEVKILRDYRNVYEGLGDIDTFLFISKEEARKKMIEELNDAIEENFLSSDMNREDLNLIIDETYCSVDNDNDYYSSEIVEHFLEIK